MSLVRINRHPSRRDLAWFGLIWLLFFAAIAWSVYRRSRSATVAELLLAWSVVVPVVGWIWPPFMRIVYLGMSYAAFPIGVVVMHVVMAAIYFLVLSPLGWLLRLCGYDPMHRKFEPNAESYWTDKPEPPKVDQYFRQF